MSSIFSDPFFRRGATLLGGETIEYSDPPTNSKPIAGGEIVGQVKVFQDVEPTGTQKRLSNRLVYCVAARYKGSTVLDASTVAGEAYIFDDVLPCPSSPARLLRQTPLLESTSACWTSTSRVNFARTTSCGWWSRVRRRSSARGRPSRQARQCNCRPRLVRLRSFRLALQSPSRLATAATPLQARPDPREPPLGRHLILPFGAYLDGYWPSVSG